MRLGWPIAVFGALATQVLRAATPDFSVQKIYTDTVAYCDQPHAILVNGLNLTFYRKNNSAAFAFNAATIPNNLSSTLNLHLYAFGLDIVEFSLNLCSIANNVLCPLPNHAISGAGEYTLPPDTIDKVPGIVYTVLDIEAVVILHVIDNATNKTAECLQVTLSNGRSTNIPAVRWAVVGATGGMAVVALVHSVWPIGLGAAQWRIVDVLYTLQHIVYVSFAPMMLPKVFYEFALLFMWTTGVVFIEPVQRAILNMRLRTGAYDNNFMYNQQLKAQVIRDTNLYATKELGADAQKLKQNLTDIISLAAAPKQRRSMAAPLQYAASLFAPSNVTTPHMLAAGVSEKIAQFAPNTGPGGEMAPGAQGGNVVYVSTKPDFSQYGIKSMAERMQVSPYGLFLTALIDWLFFLCMALVALAIMYVIHAIVYKSPNTMPRIERAALKRTHVAQLRLFYRQAARPVLIRVLQMATQPLLIYIIYQWSHSRSWASHLVAAFTFAVLLGVWVAIVAPVFHIVRRTRNPSVLYFDEVRSPYDLHNPATQVGSLVHPWVPRCYWFAMVQPVFWFVGACFIAFPQGELIGLRQCVGLLAVECIYFVLLMVFRPGRDRTSDWFNGIMSFSRIAAWAVAVSLAPESHVYGIPRAVLGYVLLVVTGVPYVLAFFVFVWDAVSPLFFKKQRWHQGRIPDSSQDTKDSTAVASDRWSQSSARYRSARGNDSDEDWHAQGGTEDANLVPRTSDNETATLGVADDHANNVSDTARDTQDAPMHDATPGTIPSAIPGAQHMPYATY